MKLCKDTKNDLLRLAEDKKIYLEGSILKVIDIDDEDDNFIEYVNTSIQKDKERRRRGLEITKQIQKQNLELQATSNEKEKLMTDLRLSLQETENDRLKIETQNKELTLWKEENERISEELKSALVEAEVARKSAVKAKEIAENDLDILQKKTQFELMGNVVRVSVWIIIGVGVSVTGLYITTMTLDKDTSVIGPVWSNIVSILLTNAFSIVGTIMGIKYASKN